MASDTPRDDQVICPACCHQFDAICVADQRYRNGLERELSQAQAERDALKALLRDALAFWQDNWEPAEIVAMFNPPSGAYWLNLLDGIRAALEEKK